MTWRIVYDAVLEFTAFLWRKAAHGTWWHECSWWWTHGPFKEREKTTKRSRITTTKANWVSRDTNRPNSDLLRELIVASIPSSIPSSHQKWISNPSSTLVHHTLQLSNRFHLHTLQLQEQTYDVGYWSTSQFVSRRSDCIDRSLCFDISPYIIHMDL
jgi:hypothetical protein